MKRTRLLLLLTLFLAGCHPTDGNMQKNISGTWSSEMPGGGYGLLFFDSNGHYKCHISEINGKNIDLEGTLSISNGNIIETVTKNSSRNFGMPYTVHGKLIKLDKDIFIIRYDGMGTDSVLKKTQNP